MLNNNGILTTNIDDEQLLIKRMSDDDCYALVLSNCLQKHCYKCIVWRTENVSQCESYENSPTGEVTLDIKGNMWHPGLKVQAANRGFEYCAQ